MPNKHIFFFVFLLAFAFQTKAQELRASLKVSTPQLQYAEPQLFENLERELNDFLNNTSFTGDEYEEHEKIKCSFQLSILDELGDNNFSAELTLQSSRPVYNSEYESVVLSYVDKNVQFEYLPSTPIQYAENGYINNLSSVLSYWAIIMIAHDYDTFKPFGGDKYFKQAEAMIVTIPEQARAGNPGWRATESDKNRYWLVENYLNPTIRDYRNALYRYHRQGLDIMATQPTKGQQTISDALTIVKAVRGNYPNSMILQLFSDAKATEVVEIMVKAPRPLKSNAYGVMSTIDPSNRTQYLPLR